ncbi:MAG: hypothetical protein ACLUIO_00520 [Neglectibacter timonensis]|jgi:hypothetical protein
MTYTVKKPLSQFEFWSGAKERTDNLTIEQLDRLDDLLSEAMEWNETDNTPSDTTINDLFWFEDDYIAQLLGFKNWEALERHNAGEDDDDTEDDEEDETDEDET